MTRYNSTLSNEKRPNADELRITEIPQFKPLWCGGVELES